MTAKMIAITSNPIKQISINNEFVSLVKKYNTKKRIIKVE